MSLLGSRDWSGVARSAFRGACMITCVIAAWPSMIWESSWSKTLRTRSGRFGSVSAEIGPRKKSRLAGSWLSHLIRLSVPSAISELSADNEVALELALWDSVKDGSTAELESYLERYPEGTFA